MFIAYLIFLVLVTTASWKYIRQCFSKKIIFLIILASLIGGIEIFLLTLIFVWTIHWENLNGYLDNKPKLFIVMICWIIAVKGGLLLTHGIERKLLSNTLNAFTPTINALETFKTKNGYYPNSLDTLIPSYIQVIPSEKELLHYDAILYEPSGKNGKDSLRFVDESPDFTFIFFSSLSIAGEEEIQYCPIKYTCRYEVDHHEQVDGEVVTKKLIIDPDRIDDNWIHDLSPH